MRCIACNTKLTDAESVLKNNYGEFVDLCLDCLDKCDPIGITIPDKYEIPINSSPDLDEEC